MTSNRNPSSPDLFFLGLGFWPGETDDPMRIHVKMRASDTSYLSYPTFYLSLIYR